MRRLRRRPGRSRGICGVGLSCGNAGNSGGDEGAAEFGEHVFERGFGLLVVPGLRGVPAGDVVGVVAVEGVPDGHEALDEESERHGPFDGALERATTIPATTRRFPRPILAGPCAAPSWVQKA